MLTYLVSSILPEASISNAIPAKKNFSLLSDFPLIIFNLSFEVKGALGVKQKSRPPKYSYKTVTFTAKFWLDIGLI